MEVTDETSQQRGAPVRPYDFRRPMKFRKDLLRTLVMIHENFARLLQSFLLARLRTRVQVNLRATNQFSYAEYTQSLPNPAVIGTVRLEPLPGTCLVELSQNLAFVIVNRVFGGSGSGIPPQRALSEIERGVIQRTMVDLFSPLQDAWRNVADIHPALEGLETNPLFLQTAVAPSEVLAVIDLDLQIGNESGSLTLALPFSTVEPVLARLSPHTWLADAAAATEMEPEVLQSSIQGAPVQLRVLLGETKMTVQEFVSLAIGDVIPLPTKINSEVPVFVGNWLTYIGRPGEVQGRMAVQILRKVDNPRS